MFCSILQREQETIDLKRNLDRLYEQNRDLKNRIKHPRGIRLDVTNDLTQTGTIAFRNLVLLGMLSNINPMRSASFSTCVAGTYVPTYIMSIV